MASSGSGPALLFPMLAAAAMAGCILGPSVPSTDDLPGRIPGLSNALELALPEFPLFGDDVVRAREFYLATDPNNPDRLAAAYMVMKPRFFWTGLARSDDGGLTWSYRDDCGYPDDPPETQAVADPTGFATCPYIGGWAMGDPVVKFLPDGTLLFAKIWIADSLSMVVERYEGDGMEPDHVVVVARSGHGFAPGAGQIPGPYRTFYNDKEQFGFDPETGELYLAWSAIYRHGNPLSSVNPTRGYPVIAKSTDGGVTWSDPNPILKHSYETVLDGVSGEDVGWNMGAWPVVTRDGRLHVFWWNPNARPDPTIVQAISTDGAASFGEPRVLLAHNQPFDGATIGGLGIPSVGIDRSGGPYDGTVYMTFAGQMKGQMDVFVVYSRDNAETWSDPVRVNDDPNDNGRNQFFPELLVEPSGAVSVLFHDQRDVDDPEREYHTYVARSIDGGRTFKNFQVTSEVSSSAKLGTHREATNMQQFSSVIGSSEYVGDYNGITYNRDGLVLAWQDIREFSTGYVGIVRAE